MRVRFIRAWKAYCVGDVVDVPDGMGTELINIGRVVRDSDPQLTLETAAVEPAELRTADVTPRRRRK
jgi:hypothetical protein